MVRVRVRVKVSVSFNVIKVYVTYHYLSALYFISHRNGIEW